ncbi:MAG: RidA family protein [Sphingomonas sp.]|nr:RidA family protein [Sphingomonas sp.]
MSVAFLNPPALARPGSYSHVAIVPAGRQVHLSGQVALDTAGALVGRGDLAAQAAQVFTNIHNAMAAVDLPITAVFKLTLYVVDLTPERADIVRAARAAAFGAGPYPAATMIGVSALVDPDLLIEVEAIAFAD